MEVGCFLTYYTITLSFINVGDPWSFKKWFLRACIISCCNWSKDILYKSIIGSSIRRTTSPCLLEAIFDSGGGGDRGPAFDALGMTSVSWSYGFFSNSVSISSTACSTCWASSQSCNCSPSSSYASCFDSSTCIGTIFFMIASFPSSFSFYCFYSLSFLLISCSSFNFFSISCNFLSTSSNHSFYLFLRSSPFLQCCLFAFTSKVSFLMRGTSLNM